MDTNSHLVVHWRILNKIIKINKKTIGFLKMVLIKIIRMVYIMKNIVKALLENNVLWKNPIYKEWMKAKIVKIIIILEIIIIILLTFR
jgi:hypothetical protein